MIAAAPLFPVIETERLRLISPAGPDFDAQAAFLSEDSVRFVDSDPDDEATWWSLATIIGHWHLRGYGHFAVIDRASGTHLGLVGPWYPKGWPEPELSWHLVEGAEGRGVAQEAAEAVLHWLFRDLGWASCASLIPHDNAGSIALAERLSARREGVFRHKMAGEMQIWRHVPRTAAGQRLIEDMQ